MEDQQEIEQQENQDFGQICQEPIYNQPIMQEPVDYEPEPIDYSQYSQQPMGGWNKKWCTSTKGGSCNYVDGRCKMCKLTKEEKEKESD